MFHYEFNRISPSSTFVAILKDPLHGVQTLRRFEVPPGFSSISKVLIGPNAANNKLPSIADAEFFYKHYMDASSTICGMLTREEFQSINAESKDPRFDHEKLDLVSSLLAIAKRLISEVNVTKLRSDPLSPLGTRVLDLNILAKACELLGLKFIRSNGVCRSVEGSWAYADPVIKLKGRYDIWWHKAYDISMYKAAGYYLPVASMNGGDVEAEVGKDYSLLMAAYQATKFALICRVFDISYQIHRCGTGFALEVIK